MLFWGLLGCTAVVVYMVVGFADCLGDRLGLLVSVAVLLPMRMTMKRTKVLRTFSGLLLGDELVVPFGVYYV